MKKYLVDLFDRSNGKKSQYVVKAGSMEEAFHLATDYYNRRKQAKQEGIV